MEVSLELMEDARKRLGYDTIAEHSELAHLWDCAGQDALMHVYRDQAVMNVRDSARGEEIKLNSLCHKSDRVSQPTSANCSR